MVATLSEELHRKTLESMTWLITEYQNSRISPAELSTALDAVFMATGGLIDTPWYHEMFAFGDKVGKKAGRVMTKLFMRTNEGKNPEVNSLSWKWGDDKVIIIKYAIVNDQMVLLDQNMRKTESPAHAKHTFDKSIPAVMLKHGFQKLYEQVS